MSAQDFFEDDLLELIFENTTCPNVGSATGMVGSTPAGSFYISLHTAGPAESATSQATSEAAYGSYGRQTVGRTSAAWTSVAGETDNDAAVTFAQASSGSETETNFGIGSALTGAGNLFIVGALSPTLAVSTGITPEFAIGDLNVALD